MRAKAAATTIPAINMPTDTRVLPALPAYIARVELFTDPEDGQVLEGADEGHDLSVGVWNCVGDCVCTGIVPIIAAIGSARVVPVERGRAEEQDEKGNRKANTHILDAVQDYEIFCHRFE